MTLNDEQLRDVDRELLRCLREGRVTPVLAREQLEDEADRDVTSAYLQQRLKRFVEHGHARNLYDTGVYELTDDPREDVSVPEGDELREALEDIDAAFGRGDPDAAREGLKRAQEAISDGDPDDI